MTVATRPSPVRLAKANALLQLLRRGRLWLVVDRDFYLDAADHGFSRAETNKALDDLERTGRVQLTTRGGLVRITLLEGARE
jgi:hypothetical protein